MINITKELINQITINVNTESSVNPYNFRFVDILTKKIVSLDLLDTSLHAARYNRFEIPANLLNVGEGSLFIDNVYFDTYKCKSNISSSDDIFYEYPNEEDVSYDY